MADKPISDPLCRNIGNISSPSRFLDASTHLYKRLCPSVGPSVRPSVGPSVGHAFLKYRGNGDLWTIKHQGTHRIAFLS